MFLERLGTYYDSMNGRDWLWGSVDFFPERIELKWGMIVSRGDATYRTVLVSKEPAFIEEIREIRKEKGEREEEKW